MSFNINTFMDMGLLVIVLMAWYDLRKSIDSRNHAFEERRQKDRINELEYHNLMLTRQVRYLNGKLAEQGKELTDDE